MSKDKWKNALSVQEFLFQLWENRMTEKSKIDLEKTFIRLKKFL